MEKKKKLGKGTRRNEIKTAERIKDGKPGGGYRGSKVTGGSKCREDEGLR
jgi:hypothetical protein